MSEIKPKGRIELSLLTTAIVSLTFTEYSFAFLDPALGIFSALISVTILYLALSLFRGIRSIVRETVEVICLIQLYILLISSLPWFFISQSLLIPATYSILLALCLWYVKGSSITSEELGFKSASSRYVILAFTVGIPLGTVEFLILRPPPPTPTFSIPYLLEMALYMFLFVGFGEELLFRGILMTNLEKYMNPRLALILQSLIFAILHITWRSLTQIFFVFIAGLIFGLLFKMSRSLIPPTIAHGVGNIMLINILPFMM
ncbi:MAG: CPBP family intramembrane glutamic endopeptidase [Nitrososphaerota archaeon]|nr:CPBP family intramembrane glutamic endopeptidase [Nitrososphaerota archaeon]